jgi:hypothetical protein
MLSLSVGGTSRGASPTVVPDQPPPNDHQQHADKENRNGLNIARFIVEILTLLVLLWYTIVTQGLWNEADRANTIAEDANKQTRDMARIADCPWVGIYEVVLEKFAPTEKVKI